MSESGDRHSKVGGRPAVARTPEEIAAFEARNALRQFDRLKKMIEEAVAPTRSEPFRLRPSALLELNRLAIENLDDGAGTYRNAPISIGKSRHVPPDWRQVPRLVEDMCDYVNARSGQSYPVHLAAYVMWRLNWIHPFPDGNGRTTRAASYLVLCASLGYAVTGVRTIPEIIATSKQAYYQALEDADIHSAKGLLDVSAMEAVLERALAQQLVSVLDDARGQRGAGLAPIAPGSGPELLSAAPKARGPKWSQRPKSFRVGAVATAALAAVGGAWQLLINWDHPRVRQVRDWVLTRFDGTAAKPGAEGTPATPGAEEQGVPQAQQSGPEAPSGALKR